MTTVTIPVGSQPFLKTAERPINRTAGEAIDVMSPIYYKSSVQKYFVGDSDPTAVAAGDEPYVIVGIAISKSETDSQVLYVSNTGTIIDFGGTLTVGDNYWLDGAGGITNAYADITSGDQVVKLGYCNENGDFVVSIINQGETK